MKLVIFTQVYENYAWQEDGSIGKGEAAYWKAKGGDEYVIAGISNDVEATAAVMAVRDQIERADDYIVESVIDWKIVNDDYLTEFELNQLEFDGKILYPAKELVWA